MSQFDTVLMVDWSAASQPSPKTPSKDAIWIGIARGGVPEAPMYCRTRVAAEDWLRAFLQTERAAGRRVLACFDFPFGYPAGLARRATGSNDPFRLWRWLEERISDGPDGKNNRFDVAEKLNALFDGPGPFWGKSHKDRWPGIPYEKRDIRYAEVSEKRICDAQAHTSSSCFQLFFNPTVGSQMLMGLPMLSRMRRMDGVRVWPFEEMESAQIVLAETWPGLIEPAVRAECDALKAAGQNPIRDEVQVRLLSQALSKLRPEDFADMITGLPGAAREEAWVLGTGYQGRLSALAAEAQIAPKPLAPPPLTNDCFALPPGVDWQPVDAALTLLQSRLRPAAEVETLPLMDLPGRILATDMIALRANPPHPNTAVDGYGFVHASLGPPPHVVPLVPERAAAGDAPMQPVPFGSAIRILTGAALPEGVDTVVLQEDTTTDGAQIAFNGPVKLGSNTRKAGEDFGSGDVLLCKGRRVTPADIALLAAAGVRDAQTYNPLRVGVISTGDELVEPGTQAGAGKIYDANRPMLLSLLRYWGIEAHDFGIVADNRDALATTLDDAAARCDAILTSGGASAGDEDHVSALLKDTGSLSAWRIALKPGRPLALGVWNGTPVFGLPGNPVAALVCTLIFGKPALDLLGGAGWHPPRGVMVPAAFAKNKKPGRREYLRARIRDGKAEVFRSEGSGRISGLSWAEGLVELPDGAATIEPGTPVKYMSFADF